MFYVSNLIDYVLVATEDNEKAKDKFETKAEVTELLSPSEVVKMRKKSRTMKQELAVTVEPPKEKEAKNMITKNKANRAIDKTNKKEKLKDNEKKLKEMNKGRKERNERENEVKRPRNIKDKKRSFAKKVNFFIFLFFFFFFFLYCSSSLYIGVKMN